ncbi:unnamed protein product [Cuscuta epithymum]|uniref:Uncharacterized protein n=1 Tax=Cuscuta epithymum TaxID=186058 RepID=A0AAV0E4E3_9ASTE|nr:unnamed protein product [Cuscuta epithymum]
MPCGIRAIVPPVRLLKYDFSKVCPCNECSEKTKAIVEFENYLHSKFAQIQEPYTQLFFDIERFTSLLNAFWETTKTWTCLQHSLKSLHEKSGVSHTRSNSEEHIRDVLNQTGTFLVNEGELDNFVLQDECEGHDNKPTHLDDKIRVMHWWFESTKFKDVVHDILRKMKELENQKHKDGKSAEEGKMSLNLSNSKKHLEDQMKLFKGFPFEDMHVEIKLLLRRGGTKYQDLVEDAMEAIWKTYCARVAIRERFHEQSEMISCHPCKMDREKHLPNELGDFLDHLLNQAKTFREVWDRIDERLFGPSEEPDPKRQKL